MDIICRILYWICVKEKIREIGKNSVIQKETWAVHNGQTRREKKKQIFFLTKWMYDRSFSQVLYIKIEGEKKN